MVDRYHHLSCGWSGPVLELETFEYSGIKVYHWVCPKCKEAHPHSNDGKYELGEEEIEYEEEYVNDTGQNTKGAI